LAHIAEEEGLDVEPSALEYIARQGGGSMRDAISLLDQLTAYGSDTITLTQVQTVLGAVATQAVMELAESLVGGDLARGLEVIDRVIGDGAESRQFTREFVEYLRGLLLLKMGDGAGLLHASVPDETLAHMKEHATRLSPRALLRATRLFNTAALEMKVGFLPQLPLELAFVEAVVDESAMAPAEKRTPSASSPSAQTLKEPAPSASASGPAQGTQPGSRPPSSASAPAVKEASAQPPASSIPPEGASDISLDVVSEKWQDILAQLRQANKMVEALMRSVSLVGVEGNNVVAEAPSDLLKGRIEQPNSRSYVERAISQVIGVPASFRCVLKGEYRPHPQSASVPGSSSGEEPDQAESSSSPGTVSSDSDEVTSEEDPMLQEALSLGAEIKNVE
jgi:DNA polymerase-3 subunit gamma/tau